jgi:pimeloyl-ACP methyl ester carboxylesterase
MSILYKTANINGVNVFYREAGNRKNPTILLLHGFPSSSHMYRNLIKELADEYHTIAPDYPGNIILLLLTIQDLEIVINLQ